MTCPDIIFVLEVRMPCISSFAVIADVVPTNHDVTNSAKATTRRFMAQKNGVDDVDIVDIVAIWE